jgi:MerR family transcriptional regulator/heat shock protein HspR
MERRGEATGFYRLEVAAEIVGLPSARVRRYLAMGLVRAVAVERGTPLIGEADLARLRQIRRLSADLGLNTAGIEVALRLLDEITALRAEVERLRLR